MNIEPIIFFDLLIALFILSCALILVIAYISKIMKKLHLYLTEQEHLKSEIGKKNAELLDETRNRAIKIIEEANSKAIDIIKNANVFITASNSNLNTNLANTASSQIKTFELLTSDFTKSYLSALNDLKAKNLEIFQNISKNIEISTLSEIKKYKEVVGQETVDSEKMVKQKMEHEFSLARKEIDQYRADQIKKINDGIYSIIQRVTESVLGKAISLSQHEELIINALEKAKKEGVFSDEKQ